MIQRVNTTSKLYSATKTFPANANRSYLFIVVLTGSVTVSFGGGTGEIPLATGAFLEPNVCPTSEMTITATAATYVVHSDQQVA